MLLEREGISVERMELALGSALDQLHRSIPTSSKSYLESVAAERDVHLIS